MYKVYFDNNTTKAFSLFGRAKAFAKTIRGWYFIAYDDEIIYTQNDQIFEDLARR